MSNSNVFLFILLVVVVLVWPIDTRSVAASLVIGGNNKKCIDHERYALLDFKANIIRDPERLLSTWGAEEKEDCCKWSGVTCNNQTGHVIEVFLFEGGLEGEISPSLLNLTKLSSLDLAFNSFTGSIPMSIGSLTELRYLDLSDNLFTGTVPPECGNLLNLEYLSLGGKFGSLAIENLDWLSRLTRLKILSISGISLAKLDNWVNVILSLDNLYELSLSDCDLSRVMQPYSSSFNSSSSSSIVYLNLENNNLNSSMYDWLFPLTTNNRFYKLDLSGNMLDGIPKYNGNLSRLEILYLYNNSLDVNLSDFIFNLSSYTLQYLYASHSQFRGSNLSDDIQKFSNNSLEDIDLSFCKLLDPQFPKWIQNLKNIKSLDVSNTGISDTIPTEFWNMTPSQLMDLNLSSNNIVGQVTNLNPALSVIDLSSNNFNGLIPNVPSNLNILNLSRNKFYGGISFLCEIFDGALKYLDLSHNSFSGQLPDCLWHFKSLIVLNLGNNKLSGKIPTSLKSLIQLEVLYLYNNTFSGELPMSLKNCTSLNFLDLGENNFSGTLPVWIGENFSGLYALSLKSNNFFGPIPLQLCQLVRLQILDLSLNNLYGTIPLCLNNITSMVQKDSLSFQNQHTYQFWRGRYIYSDSYVDHLMIEWQGNIQEFSNNLGLLKSIDISSNNLTGKIPYELTELLGLVALNLSKNSLIGEIPQSVGQMKELLTLDLSKNNFSGMIPTNISQMASLSYLDVSYNNLSGRIPTGSQVQTFEPSWFTGNVGLCGLPATKQCPGDEDLRVRPTVGENEDGGDVEDDLDKWFYIGGASGFATGFWIVCSVLFLNRYSRHAFFGFLNNSRDWVYVKAMVLVAKSGVRS